MEKVKGFKNTWILTEEGLKKSSLLINENIIKDIGNITQNDMMELSDQLIVVPGFIDEHIHGSNGFDIIDNDINGLYQISKSLSIEGVTAYLATTTTQKENIILDTLKTIKNYIAKNVNDGALLLGVHLEGPFISHKFAGAQLSNYIQKPSISNILGYEEYLDIIKIVTMAIEEDIDFKVIKYLKKHDITISIGHSNSGYDIIQNSILNGVSCVTHTYNGMKPLTKDEIGLVGSALLFDELYTEIICDGIHVSKEAIKLLYKNKPSDKIILITDSLRMKNMQDGIYNELEQTIYLNNLEARLIDGTLAGSVLKMNEAVRNIMNYTGCTLETAIKFATENPAKNLGLFNIMGSIKENKLANLTVIDKNLNVYLTIRNGYIIYKNHNLSHFIK